MNRRQQCYKCLFYNREYFQDMGATIDGCEINPDIWDGLFIGKDDKEPREKCNFYMNKEKLIKIYREKWKNEK